MFVKTTDKTVRFYTANNFTDISMKEEYATTFGYTEEEIERYFVRYIINAVRKGGITRDEYITKIRKWYGGYRFSPSGDTVYSPLSIGSFFTGGGNKFTAYRNREVPEPVRDALKQAKTGESGISLERILNSDISTGADCIPLLFQTGYLTIQSSMPVRGSRLLTLGYPNMETEMTAGEITACVQIG